MAGVESEPAKATIEGSFTGPGSMLVTIGGELDLSSVPFVERRLSPLLDDPSQHVVFDLAAVTFMDSSGIAMLLRAAERVASVQVRNPSASVQLVVRATGLGRVLGIES